MLLTHLFQILADPQGDGGAPVAVARDGPVASVLQPVPKALLPHEIRNPGQNNSSNHGSLGATAKKAGKNWLYFILSSKNFISALIDLEHVRVTAVVAARPVEVLPKTQQCLLLISRDKHQVHFTIKQLRETWQH